MSADPRASRLAAALRGRPLHGLRPRRTDYVRALEAGDLYPASDVRLIIALYNAEIARRIARPLTGAAECANDRSRS